MRTSILSGVLFLGLAGACTGGGEVTYSGQVAAPQLVEISPGVQVVADYDEPIFYSDNFYWHQQDGVWYRSPRYTGGWVQYDAPSAVLSIREPSMYVHYHGRALTAREGHEARKLDKEERKSLEEQRKDMKEERKERKQERKEAEELRHEDHD